MQKVRDECYCLNEQENEHLFFFSLLLKTIKMEKEKNRMKEKHP
jgi:hypothetical protein